MPAGHSFDSRHDPDRAPDGRVGGTGEKPYPLEFAGVFKGRELTRKHRRLPSGLAPLDSLLAGGIPRGRISEILGPPSSGKTAIAAAFAASASSHGEVAAWIDLPGAFDPESVEAAGADLARILWASLGGQAGQGRPSPLPDYLPFPDADPDDTGHVAVGRRRRRPLPPWNAALKAAEIVLDAGGFGLVVVDFGATRYALSQSAALRLARAAERSGSAVLVVAARRMCGTFAAIGLTLECRRASFSRLTPGAPALFDGLAIEARVTRNKLGVFGHRARLDVIIDPFSQNDLRPGSPPASDRVTARAGSSPRRASR